MITPSYWPNLGGKEGGRKNSRRKKKQYRKEAALRPPLLLHPAPQTSSAPTTIWHLHLKRDREKETEDERWKRPSLLSTSDRRKNFLLQWSNWLRVRTDRGRKEGEKRKTKLALRYHPKILKTLGMWTKRCLRLHPHYYICIFKQLFETKMFSIHTSL